MSEPNPKIAARFIVTRDRALMTTGLGSVQASISWKRDGDDDADEISRQLRIVLSNLPGLISDCVQEAIIQSAVQDIDQEHESFFAHLGDEECEGEPDDE